MFGISILGAIWKRIKTEPDNFSHYENLYYMCLEAQKHGDRKQAAYYLKLLIDRCELGIRQQDGEIVKKFHYQIKLALKAAAYDNFDCYIRYMEWNREPKKRFYQPRRKVLKQVVDALQELEDGILELLAVSLPPGAGKTTLAIFYLTWVAGRHPEEPSLTGSHSNSFVRGVYDEVLRMVDPAGEYLWQDIFPGVGVCNTNAKDCRIDFDKRKRFETLQFTSIGTGNAGLYRAMWLLYCDDLVSGIEVALNKERLDKLWEVYTTDLRQRKIGDHVKELHISTRWSVHDVIGRLEDIYSGNPKARFIVVPAMDENDESNFDYEYGVGFSTEFYRQQRDIMDEASWRALYMNEPIEREGLVYHENELRRFFELPLDEPDAIIGICDTKDKGTDYAVLPVAWLYGQDYYIGDVLCDNNLPDVVDIRMTDILVRNRVGQCRFESNSAGGRVAQRIQENVKARGGHCNITTKYTTTNKETRIIINSAWVKEHCLFLDNSLYKPNSDYGKFMKMLCSYTMAGKNKNDDVPDAMGMFAEYAQGLAGPTIQIIKRPW